MQQTGHKERFKKKLLRDIKIFLKKSNNMVANNIEVSENRKNEGWLSIEKNIKHGQKCFVNKDWLINTKNSRAVFKKHLGWSVLTFHASIRNFLFEKFFFPVLIRNFFFQTNSFHNSTPHLTLQTFKNLCALCWLFSRIKCWALKMSFLQYRM